MSKRILRLALPLVIFSFLAYRVYQDWGQVAQVLHKADYFLISLAVLFALPLYFLTVLAWFTILQGLGAKLTLRQTLRVWMFANLGRFIPGTIWQYLGRVALAEKQGLARPLVVGSLVLEISLLLISGVLLVILSVPFWGIPSPLDLRYLLIFTPLLIVVLKPEWFGRVSRMIQKLLRRDETVVNLDLPVKFSLTALFFEGLSFTLSGVVVFLLLRAIIPLPAMTLLSIVGMYALSWLIGYVTLIAPGGVGVTEGSLAALLSLYAAFPLASVVAVGFRVVLTIVELITLAVVLLINHRL